MKKRLTRSLMFYDIITFILIFISVFVIFESIIKKIFVDFSTDRYVTHFTALDFDMTSAFSSLEEKFVIDYKENSIECINYLIRSYLSKAKYDNSLIFFVFENGDIFSGKKDDLNYKVKDVKYEDFKTFSNENLNKLVKIKINKINYIAYIRKSNVGIRKNFSRESTELSFPFIILAEREKDFFFIIEITRWFFVIWVFIILGIIGILKIFITEKAAKQIKIVSDMLVKESENIKTKGIIGEVLKDIESEFLEVYTLNKSSLILNNTLNDLKKIVLGVTNKEFFIGVITNDKNIIEQHKAYCAIIFLDIKGFTSISEKHNENSMKIGIHIFSQAGLILNKYGGEIRKLLGDAALITFKKHTDEPVVNNALRAAIEILEKVPQINKDLNAQYNPEMKEDLMIDFNFRVGLDAGEINEGLYGTPDNFEYGIIGDPVNTASRFEALNKQYYTNLLVNERAINDMIEFDSKSLDKLYEDYKVKLLTVDEARPKGKIMGNKIFTVIKDEENNLVRPIGWKNKIDSEVISKFSILLEKFKSSIIIWKHVLIDNDKSKFNEISNIWSKLVKEFAILETDYGFLPANQYIKLMLKYNEYTLYQKNHKEFIKKDIYELKTPDEDWLTNPHLMRELDK